MQLLKQVPRGILSSFTFPLILSVTTCCLIETIISFFNSYVLTSHWHLNDVSLEPNKSFILSLFRSLRGLMMNISHSYFDFTGIVLILHLGAIIVKISQEYLKKRSPMTLLETQQDTQQENSFRKQKSTQSPSQCEISNLKKKYLKYLLYFTFSYCLCQLITSSSRSIFVGAKNIPIQEHDVISHINKRILEEEEEFQEKQETFSDIINPQQQGDLQDRLPVITKTEGAISTVVSKDGNKVFQILSPSTYNPRFRLSGMDISDPLAIKYYPSGFTPSLGFETTLVLSSDAKTLFLVAWSELYIYNISSIQSPPEYVSTTEIPTSSYITDKPAAVLYEEKNVIIIANDNLKILNVSDLKNPVIESSYPLYGKPRSIALLPQQKMILVGTQDSGLQTFDL